MTRTARMERYERPASDHSPRLWIRMAGGNTKIVPSKGRKENPEKWLRLWRALVLISKTLHKVAQKKPWNALGRPLILCFISFRLTGVQQPRLEPQYWPRRVPLTAKASGYSRSWFNWILMSCLDQGPITAATNYLQKSTLGPYEHWIIALWVLAQVYLSGQVPRAQFKLTQRFPQFFKGGLE